MNGRASTCLVTFFLTWHQASCVFFHEQSAILVTHAPDPTTPSDFGFSLGYFRETLVVSDPRSSQWGLGEIYRCSLNLTTNTNCTSIPINVDMEKYSKAINDKQNFYLGGTIAATDDFFFTCAPLAVMEIKKRNAKEPRTDAFGSCFTYNEAGPSLNHVNGPAERYITDIREKHVGRATGGYGWNSLADQANGLLLVAKTPVYGDIDYWKFVNKNIGNRNPQSASVDRIAEDKFFESWDIGYGLAAGNFFSNKTVYAVSMQTRTAMSGEIVFLEPVGNNLRLMNRNRKPYHIIHRGVNAMFGYAMAAADINLDGLSELIVGAPAQSVDGYTVEGGAVHIYLGGSIDKCHELGRMRSILAEKEQGRFGTSIATGDIDGDNVAEVFVSAPYEDSGVVYVLSGYDLRSLVTLGTFKQVWLSELKLTQRLKREDLRLFGFSLQVIPDVDGNGYNEFAVGAPGSSSVLLFRSFQTINVTVSLQILGSRKVKEEDKNFTIGLCLHVGYNSKSVDVSGLIEVTCHIDDPGVNVTEPTYKVYLSKTTTEYCKNIDVLLNDDGPGDYKFVANLKIDEPFNTTDFNTSWAVLSPYSDFTKSLDIPRHCNGEDCDPKLSMLVYSSVIGEEYALGSSSEETVTVLVHNAGHAAYGACVRLRVRGARVARLACVDTDGQYVCLLTEPVKRDANRSIIVTLDMKKGRSNQDTELQVNVELYENCNIQNKINTTFRKPYSTSLEISQVYLEEVPHSLTITDRELLNDENDSIKDTHDYSIINNGSLIWNNVMASIRVEKQKFISMVKTTKPECEHVENTTTHYEINCVLTLLPNSTTKIAALIHMSKKELREFLLIRKTKTNTTSEFILKLFPTEEKKQKSLVSEIELAVDVKFGNNKTLVYLFAFLTALFILIIIAVVLKKYGFFKRNQKQRLDVLRESVRKRSIRLASESKMSQKASVAAGSGIGTSEDGEDCVFGEVSVTPPTTDDVMLVEAEAQVHVEKCI